MAPRQKWSVAMSELSGLVHKGGKVLGGILGKMKGLIGEVTHIAAGLAVAQSGGQLGTVIVQAHTLFQKLSSQVKEIPASLSALNKLTKISSADLGAAISSQINLAIHHEIGTATKVIQSVLQKPITEVPTLIEEIQKSLPADWAGKNTPELIQGIQSFQQMGSSIDIQTQAILENFFPGNIKELAGIIDLGLHTVFDDLQSASSAGIDLYQTWTLAKFKYDLFITNNPLILPSETLGTELKEARLALENQITKISKLLPDAVHNLFGNSSIRDTIESSLGMPDAVNAIIDLVGSAATSGINQASQHLEQTLAYSDPIVPLGDLFGSIKAGNVEGVQNSLQALSNIPGMPTDFKFTDGDIDGWLEKHGSELIQTGLSALEKQIEPFIQGGLDKIAGLANLIPAEASTAVIRALPNLVEAYTGLGRGGGRLQIAGTSAALIGPFNSHQVFAGLGSAGIRTPFGTFGLGAGGASIFSQGSMLFRTASLVSNLAHGISLTPQGAALSAFFDAARWNDETHSPQPSATIGATGNQVVMESLNAAGEVHHRIMVSDKGIFLNDFDATDLSLFNSRIETLQDRIDQLFALLPNP